MKSAIIIASIIILCTGCARPDMSGNAANYNFKGNLNHQNGDDCWYRCFWR